MKTFQIKLSSSFIFALISFNLWAKPVAQVIAVKGAAFAVSPDGKTISLKEDQHIDENFEILVGEGATASLSDYYDSSYHLTAGSHLKFNDKTVLLKKGKVWIQSLNGKYPLLLTTANAVINYSKSEYVATFDQVTARTQALVIGGEVEFANLLEKENKYPITSGAFSVIDPKVENGAPRVATRVGPQSLKLALADFKKNPDNFINDKGPSREIASEKFQPSISKKKGEIIFITSSTRSPASIQPGDAHRYYKKMLKPKKSLSVPVRIFGLKPKTSLKSTKERVPASISADPVPVAKNVVPDMTNDPEFADSLKKHQVDQPKHKKELQDLIDDLKSF